MNVWRNRWSVANWFLAIFACVLVGTLSAGGDPVPQPGCQLWRLARDTFTKVCDIRNTVEDLDTSVLDEIASLIDVIEDLNLNSIFDILISQFDQIEFSKIENLNTEVLNSISIHDASICSKLEPLPSIQNTVNATHTKVCNIDGVVNNNCTKLNMLEMNDQLILTKADEILTKVCDIDTKIDGVQNFLCDTVINQSDVPFTITTPGVYCLGEDISLTLYDGNSVDSVIKIISNDVVLDLQQHSITINSDVPVNSGVIASAINIAISLGDPNQRNNSITIHNGHLINEIPAATVESSEFNNVYGGAVSLISDTTLFPQVTNMIRSTGIVIENMSFFRDQRLDTSSDNLTGIFIYQNGGTIIRNCDFFGQNQGVRKVLNGPLLVQDVYINGGTIFAQQFFDLKLINCCLEGVVAGTDSNFNPATSNPNNGIDLSAGSRVLIDNCTVTKYNQGLRLVNTTTGLVRNCNAISNVLYGFFIYDQGTTPALRDLNLTFDNCLATKTVGNGLLTGSGSGFGLQTIKNNVFRDCIALSNNADGFLGISEPDQNGQRSLENVLFLRCVASSNGGSGFALDSAPMGVTGTGCAKIEVVDCIANHNTGVGISSGTKSDDLVFVGSLMHSNGFDGILLIENSSSSVIGCNAISNGRSGMDLGVDAHVLNCNAIGNALDGIEVSSLSELLGCVAIRNNQVGIAIGSGVVRVNVVGCRALDNNTAGFNTPSLQTGVLEMASNFSNDNGGSNYNPSNGHVQVDASPSPTYWQNVSGR